jgi:hypothetical protein
MDKPERCPFHADSALPLGQPTNAPMQKIGWIIVPRITESQLERLVIDLGASLPNFQRNLKQNSLDVYRMTKQFMQLFPLR